MSNNYKEFEALLKDIRMRTGYDEPEISVLAGRNKGYISQIRSRWNKKGEEIPEKFIELLKLRFANQENILTERDSQHHKVMEALVRIEARQVVHDAYIAEVYSKLWDVPATKVLKEMEQMGNKEVRRLLDGLK